MAGSPDFSSAGSLGKLLEQIVNAIGTKGLGTTTNYQDDIMQQQKQMFNDPLGSGIFQGLVGSVLNALRPSEDQATQNLTDMFRAAGGGSASQLQGGAFAKQAQLLQGNILENRSNAVSGLAQNSMQQLMQALNQGFNMGEPNRTAPLDTIKLLLGALTGGIGVSGAQTAAQGGGGPSQSASGPANAMLQQLLSSLGATGPGGTSAMNPSYGPSPAQYSPMNPGTNPLEQANYSNYGNVQGYDNFGGGGAYFDPNPQPDYVDNPANYQHDYGEWQ